MLDTTGDDVIVDHSSTLFRGWLGFTHPVTLARKLKLNNNAHRARVSDCHASQDHGGQYKEWRRSFPAPPYAVREGCNNHNMTSGNPPVWVSVPSRNSKGLWFEPSRINWPLITVNDASYSRVLWGQWPVNELRIWCLFGWVLLSSRGWHIRWVWY